MAKLTVDLSEIERMREAIAEDQQLGILHRETFRYWQHRRNQPVLAQETAGLLPAAQSS